MKIICFLGGMLVGGALVYLVIEKKVLLPSIYNSAAAHAAAYHRILAYTREGKTNDAIDSLESELDGELLHFFNYDKNQPRIDPMQFRIISRIATYRQTHPHKTESKEVDAAVQKVLAMPAPQLNSP
ncbi:MAG: hypothetical protein HY298_03595 [Verrucomicrobia bacterium]|nr:hypothetical protein [Verrucomicrobiota bacterium]